MFDVILNTILAKQLLQQIKKWKKPSGQYSLTVRAEIGNYACHHGVTAPVAASQVS